MVFHSSASGSCLVVGTKKLVFCLVPRVRLLLVAGFSAACGPPTATGSAQGDTSPARSVADIASADGPSPVTAAGTTSSETEEDKEKRRARANALTACANNAWSSRDFVEACRLLLDAYRCHPNMETLNDLARCHERLACEEAGIVSCWETSTQAQREDAENRRKKLGCPKPDCNAWRNRKPADPAPLSECKPATCSAPSTAGSSGDASPSPAE